MVSTQDVSAHNVRLVYISNCRFVVIIIISCGYFICNAPVCFNNYVFVQVMVCCISMVSGSSQSEKVVYPRDDFGSSGDNDEPDRKKGTDERVLLQAAVYQSLLTMYDCTV